MQEKKTRNKHASIQGQSKEIERKFEPMKKVNPIEMLFFDCLTKGCKKWFNCGPCNRSRKTHEYFSKGLEEYYQEIDIVNIIY